MEGWIKLHRNLVNWEWYKDANVSKIFMHLLLCAVFKPTRWAGTELQPGQYVCTIKRLSEDTGLSSKQVRTALEKLSQTGDITLKATNKNTLVTIVNYDLINASDEEEGKQTANGGQTNGEQTANKTEISENGKQTVNENPNEEQNEGKQTANEWQTNGVQTAYEKPPVYRLFVYNTEADRLAVESKRQTKDKQTANEGQTNGKQTANEWQTKGKHNKNDKNDKNDKKEKKDIISFEGVDYVYNTSFDYEGLEDEIQDIKFGVYYQLYIQNMARTGLNRFVKQALLREPHVMRHLVNRGFFIPAGELQDVAG